MISIRGARTHNLKNVSLDIPTGKLTVLTGVSGSGKSSLAFDTLYAEGQRQYIDSLSVYARQYLNPLQRPDVDSIVGLQPTLCIDQRPGAANPRSTVGTITEIYDYLRLLMARVGIPHCYSCGKPILQLAPDAIRDTILKLPEETRVMVFAPMVRGRKGSHREVFAEIQKAGLLRMRVDGELHDVESPPVLGPRTNHSIEAVVDRFVLREGIESRVGEAVSLALRLAQGLVSICYLRPEDQDESGNPNRWSERLFSTLYSCPDCGVSYEEVEPRTFSFNSPYGACSTCDGMGRIAQAKAKRGRKKASEVASPEVRRRPIEETAVCNACHGTRLRPEALSVKLQEQSIAQIVAMPIGECLEWIEATRARLADESPGSMTIGAPIFREMVQRLKFLVQAGVDYLTLDRAADTLSGGELQRVRLATSIGSGLIGVSYVLDEPSIGLHQRDNDRLIEAIRDLQRKGNTLLVVEHDEAMMRAADCLIDMGPGAGSEGGQIVAMGSTSQVMETKGSTTADFLSGRRRIEVPKIRRPADVDKQLLLEGASTNNLQSIDVRVPLGCLVGVTGVSGSGKSSLINETLVPAIAKELGWTAQRPSRFRKLHGMKWIDKLIAIDQSSIGRSPRSTPATYTGVFDEIRKVYAQTRDAKQRGFASNRFSFNTGEGRCEACQGQGQQKIEMAFLSEVFVECNVCGGDRFNRQTLQVKYKEKNIAECLNMSVQEAAEFFENFDKIFRTLDCLRRVGLGYISLGQPSTTLSGGESQRIKLATELARADTGHTFYVLDEPTTGLHFVDIQRLLDVLQGLVDKGNTVLVIEHNLDVIKCCDWLLDLGPEGGRGGGQLVAEGTPEAVANNPSSITGKYLRSML